MRKKLEKQKQKYYFAPVFNKKDNKIYGMTICPKESEVEGQRE